MIVRSPHWQPLEQYPQFILHNERKEPLSHKTLKPWNPHDPDNWLTLDSALQMANLHGLGIGFVVTKECPVSLIDIDHCVTNGQWSQLAQWMMSVMIGAYWEVSMSGDGLHCLFAGDVPNHACKNIAEGVELYTEGRYVALTGTQAIGNALQDCTTGAHQIVQHYFQPGVSDADATWRTEAVEEWDGSLNDDELIRRMLNSGSSDAKALAAFGGSQRKATAKDLWEANAEVLGFNYPHESNPYDMSSADAALAQHLAFWTGNNHERMKQLMLKSALVRDKWTWHKNYLSMTVKNAAGRQTSFYVQKSKNDVKRSHEVNGCFILPSNNYSIIESAENIFQETAKHKRMFNYCGTLVELDDEYNLSPIPPEAFRSRIESYGMKTMAHVAINDSYALKPKLCSMENAKALIATEAMRKHLPPIKLVLDCSVLSEDLEILGEGYHHTNGGILIRKGGKPPNIPLNEAVSSLLTLMRDIKFTSPSDKSRAISMMITPALKMSGLIKAPCPADFAQADKSQSGKTYRLTVIAAIYNEKPIVVTLKKGGVGSVDESIGSALARGRPFILLDNFRGDFDSPFLEAAITLPGAVPVRLPRRPEILVDARSVTFQLSSNGVSTTKDMSNRSCLVRIQKNENKQWHKWPEGDLLKHIRSKQEYYLGCVFSIVKEWAKCGKQKTNTIDHDMTEWAQALDWIVQNIFKLPPLLNDHRSVQDEIANPNSVWLRAVCISAESSRRLNQSFKASCLARLCEEFGIEWPRGRVLPNSSAETKYVGTIMGQILGKNDHVKLDSYNINRIISHEYNQDRQGMREVKKYIISKVDATDTTDTRRT